MEVTGSASRDDGDGESAKADNAGADEKLAALRDGDTDEECEVLLNARFARVDVFDSRRS